VSKLVLVINSGSSSLKYQVIDHADDSVRLKGLIERIGSGEHSDHASALAAVLQRLADEGIARSDIKVVGHRVVHGGNLFPKPALVDDAVEAGIKSLVPLAPLHNAANLLGITALRAQMPSTPQVAVFDTSFHSTIPAEASTYAIPVDVAEKFGIKRYGFHGTSHQYVARRAAELLGVDENKVNLIICHIGNGASVAAIQNGQSIDTSMGLTPLEGLVMGSRSGDLDAGILFHLAREGGYDIAALDVMLNRQSGLLGLAGSVDMREVRAAAAAGDGAARLARDVYAYRIRKYISAYLGLLPQLDAVVFTAGVGENDAELRADVIDPLAHLGIRLDSAKNTSSSPEDRIVSPDDHIKTMVIATNEEAEIARQALDALNS